MCINNALGVIAHRVAVYGLLGPIPISSFQQLDNYMPPKHSDFPKRFPPTGHVFTNGQLLARKQEPESIYI